VESKIIATVSFDKKRLEEELSIIANMDFSTAYSEYVCGVWATCMVRNYSGSSQDAVSTEYDGCAKVTENGEKLKYLHEIIEKLFKEEHIKSVRVLVSSDNGYILPHKDYLEFKKGFSRLQIPLYITGNSLNSEDKSVYSMRQGEVWFVGAKHVHAGGTLGDAKKINLLIDCDPNIDLCDLFNNPNDFCSDIKPQMVERPPLTREHLKAIKSLCYLIDEYNFKDILSMLGKIHFSYDVSASTLFDWLDSIGCETTDEKVKRLIKKARTLLLEKGPVL